MESSLYPHKTDERSGGFREGSTATSLLTSTSSGRRSGISTKGSTAAGRKTRRKGRGRKRRGKGRGKNMKSRVRRERTSQCTSCVEKEPVNALLVEGLEGVQASGLRSLPSGIEAQASRQVTKGGRKVELLDGGKEERVGKERHVHQAGGPGGRRVSRHAPLVQGSVGWDERIAR